MENKIALPEIPNLDSIIKKTIERELQVKVKELARELAQEQLKSIGGPSAIVNNVELEMDIKEVNTEIPTISVGVKEHSFNYSVPEVTMKSQVIAKLHVPEVYMQRERLSFNHKHCKTVWKTKKIGLGIKTKIPQITCWETPAYADVPKTRMVLREMKTDVPELKMSLKTIKLEFPVISLGMTMVSLNVPIVKRITFDFEGVIKEFVPGISILNALFEIIQKAEEFRKELEEKVDYMISVAINPVLEALQNLQDEIITSIEKIEDRYSQISRELEDFAGEHSEVISQQAALQAEKISDLFKQLEPINNAIEKIESIHKKALELTKSIKLV